MINQSRNEINLNDKIRSMNTETDLNMMFASEPTIKSKFKVYRKSDSGTAKYTKWNYLNTQDSANAGKFVMQVKTRV